MSWLGSYEDCIQSVYKANAKFAEVETRADVLRLFTNSALHDLQRARGEFALVPKGGYVPFQQVRSQPLITPSSASQAFNTYVSGGGNLATSGAATAGANATSYAPVAVEQAASTSFKALSILSADVGVVGAAIAPLLGVGLGVGLYELNPELWTKISQAVIPWAYPDDDEVAVLVDSDGKTWIDGEIIESLKDLFTDEDIDPSIPDYESTTYTYPGGQTVTQIDITEGLPFARGNRGVIFRASSTQSGKKGIVTVDDFGQVTLQVPGGPNSTVSASYNPTPLLPVSDIVTWDISTAIDFYPSGYSMPLGTSRWSGNTVDITQLPTKNIITDDTTGSKPFYPVSLPDYDTSGSIDPQVQPDPTTPVDPDKQVSPYYLPDGLPFPNPVPDYNPQPNPDISPETQPQPTDPQTLVDFNPPIPPSGGDVAPPSVPIVPLPDGAGTEEVNGLIAVYHPTPNQLYAFSRWLWVTYADASSINLIWNNPFDGVIGCHELYCTPTDIGARNIKCGFLDSGINSAIISRYTSIDCGSIVVPEYYGNYLDYAPYTNVHIYLPFIGIMQLEADHIIGHGVNVTYHIDEYNGSCIAMITVAKNNYSNLVYQFEGNCAVEVPLSGGSQANIKIAAMTGIMQMVSSTVGGVVGGLTKGGVGGAVSGGVTGLGQGAANAATALMHAKSTVQHSGQFGASYGAMGVKHPFLIIQRPVQVQVPNYNTEYGFPAHKFVNIGACYGYLRCREVNVISSRATNEEKTMIEEYLKSGVFVQ